MDLAKSLEFDHVIVIAPKKYLDESNESVQQWKFLYVSLTRANYDALLIDIY
nr:hypothetical protein [uncultured Rhodoferax sp.]